MGRNFPSLAAPPLFLTFPKFRITPQGVALKNTQPAGKGHPPRRPKTPTLRKRQNVAFFGRPSPSSHSPKCDLCRIFVNGNGDQLLYASLSFSKTNFLRISPFTFQWFCVHIWKLSPLISYALRII